MMELTPDSGITPDQREVIARLAAADDLTFDQVVIEHLRTLTAERRWLLWSSSLAPRTHAALSRIADRPGTHTQDLDADTVVRARAERAVLGAAMTASSTAERR